MDTKEKHMDHGHKEKMPPFSINTSPTMLHLPARVIGNMVQYVTSAPSFQYKLPEQPITRLQHYHMGAGEGP